MSETQSMEISWMTITFCDVDVSRFFAGDDVNLQLPCGQKA